MRKNRRISTSAIRAGALAGAVLVTLAFPVRAAETLQKLPVMKPAVMLQDPTWSVEMTRQILARFQADKLLPDEFAYSLIDLKNGARTLASHRADEAIYPASVVKLFYLAAVQSQLEQGEMSDTPELRRALRDMIVDSNNDATALVLDMLTATTGGPELSPPELSAWSEKRNAVNRTFAGLGFSGINVNQKPWNEGPYGRERQFLGTDYQNRNKLTTAATARLLSQIAQDKWVSPARSNQMRELLKRDPFAKDGTVSQMAGFIGAATKDFPGAKQWSKAGWTDATRHDAAYVELPASAQFPGGARFVLVIFTTNHASDAKMIPAMARLIIDEFSKRAAT